MIKKYSPDLEEYMRNHIIIENNHKTKKQSKERQIEKITDVVIFALIAIVVCVATVQVFGV